MMMKAERDLKLSPLLQSLRRMYFTTQRAASESLAEASDKKAFAVRSASDLERELKLRTPRG